MSLDEPLFGTAFFFFVPLPSLLTLISVEPAFIDLLSHSTSHSHSFTAYL